MSQEQAVRKLIQYKWFSPAQIAQAIDAAETDKGRWQRVDDLYDVFVILHATGEFEVMEDGE